jgi:predicted alpha/beta hydrolase family esterase
MRTSEVDILLVPGWSGAGPDHWQSRWQRGLSTARTVEQVDWQRPGRESWGGAVLAAVARSTRPVVLVGHSCGVAAIVHAAERLPVGRGPGSVVGAFLVAPGGEGATRELAGVEADFMPYPEARLAFPSLLVASRNDPHCAFAEASRLALAWGATLVDAGEVGHVNTASGHGPWPDGLMRLGIFLKGLG